MHHTMYKINLFGFFTSTSLPASIKLFNLFQKVKFTRGSALECMREEIFIISLYSVFALICNYEKHLGR